MSTKAEYAISLHDQGYNCAQAVACSFCKEFGIDEDEMFRIAEGFGLGMGCMEMCGANRLSVQRGKRQRNIGNKVQNTNVHICMDRDGAAQESVAV